MARLIVIAAALFTTGCAPSPSIEIASSRPAAYAPLQSFVGRWTVKGREAAFIETCDWYHGGFHIVCNSENRRTDGSLGRGMSLIGYSADEKVYTYLGIGSRGRNERQTAVYGDGVFEFTGTSRKDGKSIAPRIRMGPFTAREVPFTVETSTDGGPWVHESTITYVRLD